MSGLSRMAACLAVAAACSTGCGGDATRPATDRHRNPFAASTAAVEASGSEAAPGSPRSTAVSAANGTPPASPPANNRPAPTPPATIRTPASDPPASSTVAESRPAAPLIADAAGFRDVVTPFLKAHCLRCHGPEKKEGDFRVDEHLPNDFADRAAKAKWGEVVNVLNSHEMPPEGEPQPAAADVARIVDWITRQAAHAELARRDSAIVLRRLNRDEYRNTVRDLIGVDFDPSVFPQDPPAGGFDNNGGALTVSPLHVELYYDAARAILDRALVEGPKPPSLRWRFEPETGDSDSNRVAYDGQRVIVNGGKNRVEGNTRVMHHANWDRGINARDYALPHEGEYVVRIRAGSRVPKREAVVEAARKFLAHRMEEQLKQNPKGEKWHREAFDRDLEHFQKDRMYDYGPPRLKLIQNLGGQPRVLAEMDIDAPADSPKTYEVRCRFTTQRAGLTIEYAYDIPRELENFWMQGHDNFARPELFVDWFEIEGPLNESWPPASHQRLLGASPPARGEERERARDAIARLMRRAYRRPVAKDEIDAKLTLFDQVRGEAPSFVEAMKAPLAAVLVSPHFLYIAEPSSGSSRRIGPHELANRLSYFLWSSMPDDELFRLADAGQLGDRAVILSQIDRMLADSKSEAFVRNFAGQWLGLREVGANPPAPDLYPQYDRHLETSFVGESRAFFAEILKHDLSAMNFVRSDFLVINERLARFYDVPDVRGDHFRRVPVPKGIHRGGIVTQGAVLTITSNGTRTSPVKRGTWILKNLMGIDPGLPVANAGEIAPKVPGIDKATVRQRLEIHRELPQCARCHSKIDPLGFALENFNAAGDWREREGFGYKGRVQRDDPKIDASSKLPDGREIVGVEGLQAALLKDESLFLKCLAGKMMTYALGRELGLADQIPVDAAVNEMRKNNLTLKSLIRSIATSEPFLTK